MKTRGLFLSVLMMGAVMAGCSNEELLNNDYQKPDGNEYYMAVNFFTSGASSRAAEDFAAALVPRFAAGSSAAVVSVFASALFLG